MDIAGMNRIYLICFWLAFSTLFATSCEAQQLPNQQTVALENAEGETYLQGWSSAEPTAGNMRNRFVPDNAAFAGAETWYLDIDDNDLRRASKTAFSDAGMQSVKILAFEKANPAAMAVLDSRPIAQAASVMVEGKVDGASARGIAFILFGSSTDEPPTTAVFHGFMAPTPVFEALGGVAIPGVLHFMGQTTADENMLDDGRLPPIEAVRKLNLFFAAWVEHYVLPMMMLNSQMQMQSIANMQSWNQSMGACAGDPNCSVVPDGTGGWTTETR